MTTLATDLSGSTSSSLIARLKARDPAGWERLARLYGPLVYGWARQAGLNQDDAADVAQDVFQAVARTIETFHGDRPGDSFRGWLWRITRNKLHDHHRRGRGQPQAVGGTDAHQQLQDVPAPTDDEPSPVPRSELLRRIMELIQTDFQESTWRAFWRTTIEGAAPADVARELGLTTSAVYTARSRVLARLRAEFRDL